MTKFLAKYHWVWKMGAMFLLLLVGMTLPMLLPVFLLDANGPISEWVEIPAPDGPRCSAGSAGAKSCATNGRTLTVGKC